MNNEWITDRLPTEEDCSHPHYCVYDSRGWIVHYKLVGEGEAWKPVPRCEPYVKPKRYCVLEKGPNYYAVWEDDYEGGEMATCIYTREAAERIAAIYEEVMP